MSYCRWSSMDYTCDLYCYADVHGQWITHVAASRVDWGAEGPPPSPLGTEGVKLLKEERHDEWTALNARYNEALESKAHHAIGLAHDGQTFRDNSLEAFLETLIMLRDEGYVFPEGLIDEIREEIAQTPQDEDEN